MNEYNFIDFHVNNIYNINLSLKEYNNDINIFKTKLLNKIILQTCSENKSYEKYEIIEFSDKIKLPNILFLNNINDMIKQDFNRLNITDEMVNKGKRITVCDYILKENWINLIERYDYDVIIANLHLSVCIQKDNMMIYDLIYKSHNMIINYKFIDQDSVLDFVSLDIQNLNYKMNLLL